MMFIDAVGVYAVAIKHIQILRIIISNVVLLIFHLLPLLRLSAFANVHNEERRK